MAKKNGYVAAIDGLPYILRVIFALPGLDGIIYGLYRIAKGRIIVGLLWIFLGFAIFWIIDLICVIMSGKPTILV